MEINAAWRDSNIHHFAQPIVDGSEKLSVYNGKHNIMSISH